MIGAELGDAEHAEVRDGEGAARELGRGDGVGPHALGQRARVARDLAQRLLVGVEHGRHDERVVGRDGDADVDARVELEAAVLVGAVGARELAQRQRGRLDDHVVVGGDGAAQRLGRRLELARAAATAPSMSTSVAIVNSGTVALDSAIRRAMTCCVRVSSWTLTSPFAVPVSAMLAATAGGGAAAPGGWARRRRRRCGRGLGGRGLRRRGAGAARRGRLDVGLHDPPARARCPAAPERSMPCSRAIRRATGDALARPPLPSEAGAGLGRGCARPPPPRAARPWRPPSPPGPPRSARRCPTPRPAGSPRPARCRRPPPRRRRRCAR